MTTRRFATSLQCSACETPYAIAELMNLCPKCSGPLLVRYELSPAPELRAEIARRAPNMWRYAEVLPGDPADVVTLGEGITPLLPSTEFPNAFYKDESKNPTRSFKSRG